MARALVLLLVALTASSVLAEKTSLPLTPESIAEVFKGFSEELQNTLQSTTSHGRSMLGLKEDAHSFFKDILGGNWSDHVPAAWKDNDFSLEKLFPFDLKNSMDDFLDNSQLAEFRRPHSIPELHDLFESTLAKFCRNYTFTISEKVDPFCAGPTVSLSYSPKTCIIDELKKQIICTPASISLTKEPGTCIIDELKKQIICTPASISLTKEPGVCVKKAFTPTIFIGKSCAIRKTIGVEAEVVIGGAEFDIPLNQYFPLSDDTGKKLEAKFSKFKKFDKALPPLSEIVPALEDEFAPAIEAIEDILD
ncbi:hypothetical protein F751_5704 [Auxenochlorella protothecoides]|uniref:Uncharacterized protein n=1 Tax=Auxenochlorella protothecoides TaxID=3075 RepID=A0A087SMY1_AUXPR|nr:hypothetical protein F751_5704 [Auxenochlorella protothecoides]KFM27085.1 hypothetical protein F751_5704 [Auxenochlorella protothecoides]